MLISPSFCICGGLLIHITLHSAHASLHSETNRCAFSIDNAKTKRIKFHVQRLKITRIFGLNSSLMNCCSVFAAIYSISYRQATRTSAEMYSSSRSGCGVPSRGDRGRLSVTDTGRDPRLYDN